MAWRSREPSLCAANELNGRKNWRNASKRFSISHFFRTSYSNKVFRRYSCVCLFACARADTFVSGYCCCCCYCDSTSIFPFWPILACAIQEAVKNYRVFGKRNFRTIIVRVHLVIEIFRCRFFLLLHFLFFSLCIFVSGKKHFANCAAHKKYYRHSGRTRANRIKRILINFIAVCRI